MALQPEPPTPNTLMFIGLIILKFQRLEWISKMLILFIVSGFYLLYSIPLSVQISNLLFQIPRSVFSHPSPKWRQTTQMAQSLEFYECFTDRGLKPRPATLAKRMTLMRHQGYFPARLPAGYPRACPGVCLGINYPGANPRGILTEK